MAWKRQSLSPAHRLLSLSRRALLDIFTSEWRWRFQLQQMLHSAVIFNETVTLDVQQPSLDECFWKIAKIVATKVIFLRNRHIFPTENTLMGAFEIKK